MSVADAGGAAPTVEAGSAATAGSLVRALNSPIRRSVLRFLLETAPASLNDIRRGTPGFVGNSLRHHLDLLVATGAVTREKKQTGYRERLYSPTEAIRAPWFLTVLHLTAVED